MLSWLSEHPFPEQSLVAARKDVGEMMTQFVHLW